MTWPTAAQATATPSFTLVHQDAFATLSAHGAARVGLSLRLAKADPRATVQVSLYPRVLTRGELAPLVNGGALAAKAVTTTGNFTLHCDPAKTVTLALTLFTRAGTRATSPCASRAPRLHLPCAGATCDGVFPLSYSVTSGGVATTEWSLVAVRASHVLAPLHVSLVVELDAASYAHRGRGVAVLRAIAAHPEVPLSLGADYRTLSRVLAAPAKDATAWHDALAAALTSPLHRAVVTPPPGVDFGGLAAAGLAGQVGAQLTLSSGLLRTLTGHLVDAPVVLGGHPSARSLAALARAGVGEVVVPESALAMPPSTTLTWGAPFHVAATRSPMALATDEPLAQLLTDPAIEPGRRAVLALDTLAFLHFEAPSATTTRSVVVVVPASDLSGPVVADLLGVAGADPFFVPSSLAPSFSSSFVGSNGAPATRALAPPPTSPWSARNVSSLTALVTQVTSYAQAVSPASVATALRVALAQTELVGDAATRQGAISAVAARLTAELSRFSVDAGAITLAGPGTALPITIFNRSGHTVTAVVHLVTDRLTFPKGANIAVALDAPTRSLRVPTANHRGSSLTLQVLVTTPDGQLTLARAAIQVRIAGTSVVGFLLTGASLLVLAWWWVRTHRRRTLGRHAR